MSWSSIASVSRKLAVDSSIQSRLQEQEWARDEAEAREAHANQPVAEGWRRMELNGKFFYLHTSGRRQQRRPVPDPDLLLGWLKLESESRPGSFFYFHEKTRKTLDRPPRLEDDMPAGWVRRESRSEPGTFFHVHIQTGLVQLGMPCEGPLEAAVVAPQPCSSRRPAAPLPRRALLARVVPRPAAPGRRPRLCRPAWGGPRGTRGRRGPGAGGPASLGRRCCRRPRWRPPRWPPRPAAARCSRRPAPPRGARDLPVFRRIAAAAATEETARTNTVWVIEGSQRYPVQWLPTDTVDDFKARIYAAINVTAARQEIVNAQKVTLAEGTLMQDYAGSDGTLKNLWLKVQKDTKDRQRRTTR
ncbi:unnamed protein product [Prorocentrum cordatum]|uniref:Ubiquitin-like domain-containing protein n=1 Tax=Prorocentrum cordatum TaxID=2364126 RepID=A0ABN9V2T6_9DINO|nr:unnamed protein product [Polarella glacialis]